jgi:hypothetical protein
MDNIWVNRRIWESLIWDGWELPTFVHHQLEMFYVPRILVGLFGDTCIVIGVSRD